jgi:hypothetical protein
MALTARTDDYRVSWLFSGAVKVGKNDSSRSEFAQIQASGCADDYFRQSGRSSTTVIQAVSDANATFAPDGEVSAALLGAEELQPILCCDGFGFL